MYHVTYEIVTPESAEYGDCDESGFICEDVKSLRDAMDSLFETRTSACDGFECVDASDSDIGHARWFTVYNGMEHFTGATESRSLHLPESMTPASRMRVYALLRHVAGYRD